MTACPVCKNQINEDFGLVTCPSCGSQVLIEMEGAVAAPPAPPVSSGTRSGVRAPTSPSIRTRGTGNAALVDELSQVLVADVAAPMIEAAMDPALDVDDLQLNQQVDYSPPNLPSAEDAPAGASAEPYIPPIQQGPVERKRSMPEASADMRGLADFGNSPLSQGREGFLRFDIYISGIDTQDVRKQIREILDDGRFLWDADKIMQSLKNGEICLKELPAVKSALIVQRLRGVPVEIRWEQYAINQG